MLRLNRWIKGKSILSVKEIEILVTSLFLKKILNQLILLLGSSKDFRKYLRGVGERCKRGKLRTDHRTHSACASNPRAPVARWESGEPPLRTGGQVAWCVRVNTKNTLCRVYTATSRTGAKATENPCLEKANKQTNKNLKNQQTKVLK